MFAVIQIMKASYDGELFHCIIGIFQDYNQANIQALKMNEAMLQSVDLDEIYEENQLFHYVKEIEINTILKDIAHPWISSEEVLQAFKDI